MLSFVIAGVSLFFICAEGITFGEEKVSKWITSFMSSVFSSVFLTQPIQVALTTFLIVSIFRKNTEFSKVTVEDEKQIKVDEDDETEPVVSASQFRNQEGMLPKDHHEFHTVRLERTKQRKLKQIFTKAIMHGVFLSMLFITAYSTRNLNCYNYQVALNAMISNPNAVNLITKSINELLMNSYLPLNLFIKVLRVDQLFSWIGDNVVNNTKYAVTKQNNMYKLADSQSYLIEAPMLRQIRVNPKSEEMPFFFHYLQIIIKHEFASSLRKNN
jgi:hypothetical protein